MGPEQSNSSVGIEVHASGPHDGIEMSGPEHAPSVPEAAAFGKDRLDRKLERRHITGIAFSGTIGAGLFINLSELIGIAGAPGATLAYFCTGLIVIGVMRSLAEMVSVQALTAPLIGFPDTFVDEALGFAVGIAYTLAQCLNMAVLTSVAARQANNYAFGGSLDTQAQCGIVVALCIITVLSNLLGVKLYGELERIFKWFKLLMFLGLCTLMIAVKAGAGATNVPQPPIPHQTDYSFVPSWQPAGHASTSDVSDDRSGGLGVPGEPGKFVAVWTCMTLAMFPLAGGDQVLVAAGEARSPHRDLPKAARFMYLAPICLYVLSSFLIGLNVNYADPGLLNIWTEQSPQGSYSPFIIALRYTTIEFLPGFLNALFLMSAYTAGNTGLYAASRTAFALAQRWGGPRLRNSVGRTSNGNTPVVAILACASFSLLAFLGATSSRDASSNQPISTLSSSFTSLIGCVYAAECIAYIRFKRGLDRVMVGGVSWRDTRVYQHQHYRAHWQPYGAWFGLIGCVLITLSAGWAPIFIMVAGDGLATRKLLKSNSLLAADLVGAYSGPVIFLALYLYYKVKNHTRLRRFGEIETEYNVPEDLTDAAMKAEASAESESQLVRFLKEAWSLIR